jgi:hypothetical protein
VEPDFSINYRSWDRWIAVLDLVSDGGNDRHIPLSEMLDRLLLKIDLELAQRKSGIA